MTLEIKDLTISYGSHTVLEDISFSIPDGTQSSASSRRMVPERTTLFNVIIRLHPDQSG